MSYGAPPNCANVEHLRIAVCYGSDQFINKCLTPNEDYKGRPKTRSNTRPSQTEEIRNRKLEPSEQLMLRPHMLSHCERSTLYT